MTATFGTMVLSAWLLGVGLAVVSVEVERIRIGHRIQGVLRQREAASERVRRLEIRYNRMVSPDLLWKDLPESFASDRRLLSLGREPVRS